MRHKSTGRQDTSQTAAVTHQAAETNHTRFSTKALRRDHEMNSDAVALKPASIRKARVVHLTWFGSDSCLCAQHGVLGMALMAL